MLALPFARRDALSLKGARAFLRLPARSDFDEWCALRGASRGFLEPWEPRWSPDEFDKASWRHRIQRYREDFASGHAVPLFIFEARTGRLAGGITLGNIRQGVSQSGQIGYWIGEKFAGKGLMQESVRLLVTHAFETLRLHRVEAACIPANMRSVNVLEKAGFQREGLLRAYLRINGAWQDHYLYALVSTDVRPK